MRRDKAYRRNRAESKRRQDNPRSEGHKALQVGDKPWPGWPHVVQDAWAWLEDLKRLRIAKLELPQDSFEAFLGETPTGPDWKPGARLKVGKPYFTDEAYLRQQDRADWQYADPRLVEFASKFIEAMRRKGVPVYAHSVFRTEAQQNELYDEGRSRARWPRASHCQGKAVDLVHSRYHWNGMRPADWQYFGKVGLDLADRLGIEVEWGGTWSFYDPAHWQLANWKDDIKVIKAGPPLRKTARSLLRT